MLARVLPLRLLASMLACTKGPAQQDDALLSEVKARLNERDRKLQSYKMKGTVTEGANQASYEFQYRSPNKMLGVLTAPQKVTYAFDGTSLFQLREVEKKMMVMPIAADKQAGALVLNQTFAPFAPEGYRAPLMVKEGVQVQRISHAKATEAVRISKAATDGQGTSARVTYDLRWPSGDFLAKKTEVGPSVSEVKVEEEQCDEKLKLCVPKKLSQWADGQQIASSVLTDISLNEGALPAEEFTPKLPEGFEKVDVKAGKQ